MYEEITYENLLQSMLDVALKKNSNIDTREGSIVWYGQAPAAVEAQNLYIQLDTILRETFADTASRPYLVQRALERGLSPKAATKAIGKGEFTPTSLEIPIGSRFSLNDLNYSVVDKVSPGIYHLECETPGEKGNEYIGTLIPIEYIDGLETAQLTQILIPGEDDQDTELFRQEYLNSFDAQTFGGNVADYKKKVNGLDGVGGVKVYREWNGNIHPTEFIPPAEYATWYSSLPSSTPATVKSWLQNVSTAASGGLLTVGGAVRLVIIDSTFAKPSSELVEAVQTAIDPEINHGEGLGLAPIGHYVTVVGVEQTTVNIETTISYLNDWDWEAVKQYVLDTIDSYLKELAMSWADQESPLIVRISNIESRLLNCPGIIDVGNTTINGVAENLTLGADAIPVRGTFNGA